MHTVHPSGWRRQSASTNRLAAIIVAGFCAFNLAGCSRVLDLRTSSATCEVHGDLLQTAEVDYFHGSASNILTMDEYCLLYTSPSPRDQRGSRMPSSA